MKGRSAAGSWGFDGVEAPNCVTSADGNACCICPAGGRCDRLTTVDTIVSKRRFYRHHPATAQIQLCPFPDACPGGAVAGSNASEACVEGTEGACGVVRGKVRCCAERPVPVTPTTRSQVPSVRAVLRATIVTP